MNFAQTFAITSMIGGFKKPGIYIHVNLIACLYQELLNGAILNILVCKIHKNHVMPTIMVPINFYYDSIIYLPLVVGQS